MPVKTYHVRVNLSDGTPWEGTLQQDHPPSKDEILKVIKQTRSNLAKVGGDTITSGPPVLPEPSTPAEAFERAFGFADMPGSRTIGRPTTEVPLNESDVAAMIRGGATAALPAAAPAMAALTPIQLLAGTGLAAGLTPPLAELARAGGEKIGIPETSEAIGELVAGIPAFVAGSRLTRGVRADKLLSPAAKLMDIVYSPVTGRPRPAPSPLSDVDLMSLIGARGRGGAPTAQLAAMPMPTSEAGIPEMVAAARAAAAASPVGQRVAKAGRAEVARRERGPTTPAPTVGQQVADTAMEVGIKGLLAKAGIPWFVSHPVATRTVKGVRSYFPWFGGRRVETPIPTVPPRMSGTAAPTAPIPAPNVRFVPPGAAVPAAPAPSVSGIAPRGEVPMPAVEMGRIPVPAGAAATPAAPTLTPEQQIQLAGLVKMGIPQDRALGIVMGPQGVSGRDLYMGTAAPPAAPPGRADLNAQIDAALKAATARMGAAGGAPAPTTPAAPAAGPPTPATGPAPGTPTPALPAAPTSTAVRPGAALETGPGRAMAERFAKMLEGPEAEEVLTPSDLIKSETGATGRKKMPVKPKGPAIKRQPIDSRGFKTWGYSPKDRILDLEFPDGRVYRYHGVLPQEVAAVEAAESKGKALLEITRKHPGTRQGAGEVTTAEPAGATPPEGAAPPAAPSNVTHISGLKPVERASLLMNAERTGIPEDVARGIVDRPRGAKPPKTRAVLTSGKPGPPPTPPDQVEGALRASLARGKPTTGKVLEMPPPEAPGSAPQAAVVPRGARQTPTPGPSPTPARAGGFLEGLRGPGAPSGPAAAPKEAVDATVARAKATATAKPGETATYAGQTVKVGDVLQDGRVVMDIEGGKVIQLERPKAGAAGPPPKAPSQVSLPPGPEGEATPKTRYSIEPNRLGFYSQLERVVSDPKTQVTQRGQDWLKFFKDPKRAVTAEELKWSGVDDLLAAKAGERVTKQEIIDTIRANMPEIVDTTFGGRAKLDDPQIKPYVEALKNDEVFVEEFEGKILFMDQTIGDADDAAGFLKWARKATQAGDRRGARRLSRIARAAKAIEKYWKEGPKEPSLDDPDIQPDRALLQRAGLRVIKNDEEPDLIGFVNREGDLYTDAGSIEADPAFSDEVAGAAGRIEGWWQKQFAYPGSRKPVRFEQYTVPGSTNYREMLIKSQKAPEPYTLSRVTPERATSTVNAGEWEVRGSDGDVWTHFSENRPEAEVRSWANEEALKRKPSFEDPHWEEPNVIASVRLSDRKGPNGEKILFIEELQSDWAQTGREKGFAGKVRELTAAERQRIETLETRKRELDREIGELAYSRYRAGVEGQGRERQDILNAERDGVIAELDALDAISHPPIKSSIGKIETGPFVEDTGKWTELAMKRVLRMAAEEGYDEVAWAPGSVHTQRWGTERIAWRKYGQGEIPESRLTQQIENEAFIDWAERQGKGNKARRMVGSDAPYSTEDNRLWGDFENAVDTGEVDLAAYRPKDLWMVEASRQVGGNAGGIEDIGAEAARRGMNPENAAPIASEDELARLLAQTMSNRGEADKMAAKLWRRMQTEPEGVSMPRKEGFEEFYDKSFMPNAARKIAKKFGAQVGETSIKRPSTTAENAIRLRADESGSVDAARNAALKHMDAGDEVYGVNEHGQEFLLKDPVELANYEDFVIGEMRPLTAPSIKLTPEMRTGVTEKGFPQFAVEPSDAAARVNAVLTTGVPKEHGNPSFGKGTSQEIADALPTPEAWHARVKRVFSTANASSRLSDLAPILKAGKKVGYKEVPFKEMPADLRAMCYVASKSLQKVLSQKGIKTTLREGFYNGKGAPANSQSQPDNIWPSHWWLEAKDGTIIDPTESQFRLDVKAGQIRLYPPESQGARSYRPYPDVQNDPVIAKDREALARLGLKLDSREGALLFVDRSGRSYTIESMQAMANTPGAMRATKDAPKIAKRLSDWWDANAIEPGDTRYGVGAKVPRGAPKFTVADVEAALARSNVKGKVQQKEGSFHIGTRGGRIIIEPVSEITPEWSIILEAHGAKDVAAVKAGAAKVAGSVTRIGQDWIVKATHDGVITHEVPGHIWLDHFARPNERAVIERDLAARAKVTDKKIDEAWAEWYSEWFNNRRNNPPKNAVDRVFKRIYEFFDDVYRMMTRKPTLESVARGVERGKWLKREPAAAAGQREGVDFSIAARQAVERVKNFKKWFGKSQVTDNKGRPLRLYHGTMAKADFAKFRVTPGDIGIHFGTKENATGRLAWKREFSTTDTGARIMPVFLSIKNPLEMNSVGNWNVPKDVIAGLKDVDAFQDSIPALDAILRAKISDAEKGHRIRALIERKGYDGVKYVDPYEVEGAAFEGDESYIAFHPNQIKSATGNVGTFSPETGDIRYSIGRYVKPGPPRAPGGETGSMLRQADRSGMVHGRPERVRGATTGVLERPVSTAPRLVPKAKPVATAPGPLKATVGEVAAKAKPTPKPKVEMGPMETARRKAWVNDRIEYLNDQIARMFNTPSESGYRVSGVTMTYERMQRLRRYQAELKKLDAEKRKRGW